MNEKKIEFEQQKNDTSHQQSINEKLKNYLQGNSQIVFPFISLLSAFVESHFSNKMDIHIIKRLPYNRKIRTIV